jgi:sorting nexin-25
LSGKLRPFVAVLLALAYGSPSKVKDTVRVAMSAENLEKVVSALQDSLFFDGQRRPSSEPRSQDQKLETKLSAGKKLGLLIPGELPFHTVKGIQLILK